MDTQALAYFPTWFTSLVTILLGLAVGSFVNVVIYRVPRQMSIVRPGSHCPNCTAPIRPRDNIPLVSFLLLRGRCRVCGALISWRYPVVELTLGILFWLLWRRDGPTWLLLSDWGFVAAMVALAVIDLEHRLLPDRITYPGFVLAVGLRGLIPQEAAVPWVDLSDNGALAIGTVLIASSGLVMLTIEWLDYYLVGGRIEEDPEPVDSPESQVTPEECTPRGDHLAHITIAAGFLMAGIFLLLILKSPDPGELVTRFRFMSVVGALAGTFVGAGMIWGLRLAYFAARRIEGAGFGDVKMMMMVGAYLGWPRALLTLLLASLLGSIIGLALVIRYRDRHIGIPYGLFIAMAAIVSLLIGTPAIRLYEGFYQL
jgi:prepilin signal peptidase PulO-like enzyme (type II secretory pathway)